MLREGCAFDGAVQEADDNCAPGEDSETEGAEDRAYGYENRSVGQGRMVHEGGITGWRDSRRWIGRDVGVDCFGQLRETGESRGIGRLWCACGRALTERGKAGEGSVRG